MEIKELFAELQNKLILNLQPNEVACPTCKGLRFYFVEDGGANHGYIESCRACYTGRLYICEYCGKANQSGYCNCDKVNEQRRLESQKNVLETKSKAQHIKFSEYEGMLFAPNSYEEIMDKEGFIDMYCDYFNDDSPTEVFATKHETAFTLDIYDIISEKSEEGYDDMYSRLDTDSHLLSEAQDLLNIWMEDNNDALQVYYEDNSLVVDLNELYDDCAEVTRFEYENI